MSRPRSSSRQQFSRSDRVAETVREVVAVELERVGDERLDLVTVTAVEVDADLHSAKVYYSALVASQQGTEAMVADALEELRWRIQRAVNRAIRARKTPQVEFHPDQVLAQALRIDDILAKRIDPTVEDRP